MSATYSESLRVFVPDLEDTASITIPLTLKAGAYRLLCGYAEAEHVGLNVALNELLRGCLERPA